GNHYLVSVHKVKKIKKHLCFLDVILSETQVFRGVEKDPIFFPTTGGAGHRLLRGRRQKTISR
ncbi:MAG: hypothetical protein Q9M37_09810, partial [Desulfonauticus sp.]|nr:hypothetical protein [Desulfonauticus sp.]